MWAVFAKAGKIKPFLLANQTKFDIFWANWRKKEEDLSILISVFGGKLDKIRQFLTESGKNCPVLG